MRLTVVALTVLFVQSTCYGWFEQGHHIVSNIAFDLLSETEQQEILRLLRAHPRYGADFSPPVKVREGDADWWRIGRAGYWPDVARKQPKYNRPTWHYQLGASLVLGDREKVAVPKEPGPLPDSATLDTQELHIVQAVNLCKAVLADRSNSDADRALAICWLAHLVGDAHQPCHAGSLYSAEAYPESDRGATKFPTRQRKALHFVWDALLGDGFEVGDVKRRIAEILSDPALVTRAERAAAADNGADPQTWIDESRQLSLAFVYTPEVTDPVQAVERGLTSAVERVDLSDEYLKRAGSVGRVRVAEAGYRLARVWREALASASGPVVETGP